MIATTPTLNNAQHDGIRALRYAARDLAEKMEAERKRLPISEAPPGLRSDMLTEWRLPPWRSSLHLVAAWADVEIRRGAQHHAPALRRLLDDATALLRWVDGAL